MPVVTNQIEKESEQGIEDENPENNPTSGLIDSENLHTDKKKKNSIKLGLISTAVGITISVAGYAWWQHASSIEQTDDAYITGHVHQVSSRVAGYVTAVAVDDNDHVKQGKLLIHIDPKDLELQADSAKAAALKSQWQAVEAQSNTVTNTRNAESQSYKATSAIASARAQINKAVESINDAKLGVTLTQSQIQQRQAELTRASADYERYKSLVQDRAATTQAFEKAKQDMEVAKANLDAAVATHTQMFVKVKESEQALKDTETAAVRAEGTKQSAKAAEAQTNASKDTVNVQKAAADQADIDYQNALTQLSYTKVLAPISGTVGHKTVEVGQQIDKGQALMSIVSDEKWVVANFKETQLGKMHVGQLVDMKVDALSGKHFTGHVQSISPASGADFSMLPPDNASGNFTKVVQRISVKITFDPQSIRGNENVLTPGMSVIAEVHLKN
jgi:membrane fusion protein (multidrug efflux system)